jgi:hypothetical protein
MALNDATDREAHAKDVTAATLRLEKLVLDLETGVRGFILTGNENVLGRERLVPISTARSRPFSVWPARIPSSGAARTSLPARSALTSRTTRFRSSISHA